MKKNILVLCTGNSCRSQMAEGYLRHFAKEKANIFSAGIEKHGLNPMAVKFMLEDGINISSHTSNLVEDYLNIPMDFVITVCDNAKESCPIFPQKTTLFHHNFSDPSKVEGSEEAVAAAFRNTRDEIKKYCEAFISANI